jgi:integrase
MTSKRSNGEGTIYKNESRNRFEGQVSVGINANGKSVRRKVTGRTRAEVTKKMSEVRDRCSHGPGLPSDITVGDWLSYWISSVLPSANIASATRENYETLCARYLVPRIGRIRLVKLTPADVRAMLNSMNADGYASNTQRLARAALRRALRVAEAEGYVPRNVAGLTDGVKLDPKNSRTMQPSEVKDLLSSVIGDRIEPILNVLLATGLRRSEVLGLCWGDVDLSVSPATLQISHALKRERSGLVFGEPKTKRTKRVLYIPDVTARILREHRVAQKRERLEFGPGWGGEWVEYDFVFTSPVGTPIDPSNFAKALSKATEVAGLGSWTPHEFRHTAASLMIASDVPLKQVSEALGHSSIAVTADVYGHLLAPSTATADAMAHVMYGT